MPEGYLHILGVALFVVQQVVDLAPRQPVKIGGQVGIIAGIQAGARAAVSPLADLDAPGRMHAVGNIEPDSDAAQRNID